MASCDTTRSPELNSAIYGARRSVRVYVHKRARTRPHAERGLAAAQPSATEGAASDQRSSLSSEKTPADCDEQRSSLTTGTDNVVSADLGSGDDLQIV